MRLWVISFVAAVMGAVVEAGWTGHPESLGNQCGKSCVQKVGACSCSISDAWSSPVLIPVVALVWMWSTVTLLCSLFNLTTDAPRKQLIIHHEMQIMQFSAWFFKAKTDNLSGHAAFYHSLGKERIRNGLNPLEPGLGNRSDSLNFCSVWNTEVWQKDSVSRFPSEAKK